MFSNEVIMRTLKHSLLLTAFLLSITATFSFSQEEESKLRFGGRIAYAVPSILNGQSFEIGAIVVKPIVNTITFNSGINVIYRSMDMKYYDLKYDLQALTVNIPLLFQGMPLGDKFYLEGGFQLELPSFIIEKSPVDDENPDALDYRLVLGFGWNINEHLMLGTRNSINFNSEKYRFAELGLGLTYLF